RPIRPLGFALDRLHAGPGEAFAADADAVAHRLAAAHHQVEVGVRRVDDDGTGCLAGPVVDDLPAQLPARVGGMLLRVGIGRGRHRLAVRAEQRLERIERVGGSRGGRDGACGDEGSDRGSGLQAGKIVHGTSPIDAHWSNGGAPGFKMLAEINLTAWLPAAPESVSQLISLGFLRLTQCGEHGSAATPATGRKTPQRRHDTSAGPARYGRAACQPTTASATASVEAK